MRHVTLTVHEDRCTGELGLLVEPMRPMVSDPSVMRGLGIAHDLLEHQNGIKSIGSIDDELEALGGVWFVRGQWGDLSRDGTGSFYSTEENIGSDVMRLAEIYASGVGFRTPVPRTRAHDYDDSFREIIRAGRRMLRREFDGEVEVPASFWKDALHYMRRGYNKANKRYRGNVGAANTTFWAIADAVNRMEREIEFEGQQFRLSYGLGQATCEEVYEEDY